MLRSLCKKRFKSKVRCVREKNQGVDKCFQDVQAKGENVFVCCLTTKELVLCQTNDTNSRPETRIDIKILNISSYPTDQIFFLAMVGKGYCFPSLYAVPTAVPTPPMSRVVRKPAFCICENKDADQLRGNREADQRLCFRYTDSTIPLLSKSEISSF